MQNKGRAAKRMERRLLDAAFLEFCEKKYEKVSVMSITERAEVTRSSFYYYFEDKLSIYATLIEELKQQLFSSLDRNRKYTLSELLWAITENLLSYKGTKMQTFIMHVFENFRSSDETFLDAVLYLRISDCDDFCLGEQVLMHLNSKDFASIYFKTSCFLLILQTVLGFFSGKTDAAQAKRGFDECAAALEKGFNLK